MISWWRKNSGGMLISTLVPLVEPHVTTRPPDLRDRIDWFQVTGPTFSNTTSAWRRGRRPQLLGELGGRFEAPHSAQLDSAGDLGRATRGDVDLGAHEQAYEQAGGTDPSPDPHDQQQVTGREAARRSMR